MVRSVFPDAQPAKLMVLQEDRNHVVYSYDNVIVVRWRGPQEPAVCTSLGDWAAHVATIQGTAQVAAISIAERGCCPPSPEVREALGHLIETTSSVIYRVAIVHPAGGFIEAAIRSVILGFRRVLSHHLVQDVFQRLDAAVVWATEGLPTATGRPIDTEGLMRELQRFRQSLSTPTDEARDSAYP